MSPHSGTPRSQATAHEKKGKGAKTHRKVKKKKTGAPTEPKKGLSGKKGGGGRKKPERAAVRNQWRENRKKRASLDSRAAAGGKVERPAGMKKRSWRKKKSPFLQKLILS